MKKKALALALALMLCFGLCVVPASAYDTAWVGQAPTISTGDGSLNVSAVVDENGSLWMWGCNNHGQLGLDDTDAEVNWDSKPNPSQTVPVKIMDNVVSVDVSGDTTAAIKTDGSLWMWGRNDYGQLGIGITKDRTTPVKVMDDVAAVSISGFKSAAIKTDGSLWMWGYGPLGDGTMNNSGIPVKVMDDVAAVSVGGHVAVIKTDGSLWVWGSNSCGALGTGGVTNESGGLAGYQTVPVKLMDNVISVSAGSYRTAAVKGDGSLWVWGDNFYGTLGNGEAYNRLDANGEIIYQDVPLKLMDGVKSVSLGGDFVAAIKNDGSLWMWGSNGFNQLSNGVGNFEGSIIKCQTVPVKVMDDIVTISTGGLDVLAINTNGDVLVWGFNSYGQLSDNLNPDFHGRIRVSLPEGTDPVYPDAPNVPSIPATGTAYTSAQNVGVDNRTVKFQCYALRDEKGYPTNYIKLRDVAHILRGTGAQFNISYDGTTSTTTVTSGEIYQDVGSEMNTPFSGNRTYRISSNKLIINGKVVDLQAIMLTDDKGGGYTYFKLRDIGKALNFNVSWSAERGAYINTDQPYSEAN